jgi:uncharacterized damage-inducible protein DinB
MERFFEDYLNRLDDAHKAILDAVEGLPVDALDWSPAEGVNSITVLVAHLTGAERFWIGDVAMGEYKERNRADEFKAKGLTAAELKARVEEVGAYAHGAVERLTVAQLGDARTSRNAPDEPVTVGWALVHALTHASTHAGHIQLMRDWWRTRSG